MYKYKLYDPDVSTWPADDAIAFNKLRINIFKAYAEGCLMLELEGDKRPTLEIVEKTDGDTDIRVEKNFEIAGTYHPISNRICINKDAPDPEAKVFHELYHCYLHHKGERLEKFAEEDRCEEFAQKAMGKVFAEEYSPVDQRPFYDESAKNSNGWTFYKSGYEYFSAYRAGNQLYIYNRAGYLSDIKRLGYDGWTGEIIAV